MGHELIDRIIEQTRVRLPAWDRENLGVFLFSTDAQEAMMHFTRCSDELFTGKEGLFIAPLSQESLNETLESIRQKKENHEISSAAKVMVRTISFAAEDCKLSIPPECKKQVVRLIQKDSDANDEQSLFVYNSEEGLRALLVYAFLQDMTSEGAKKQSGVLVESVIDSSICVNWVEKLRSVLHNSLNMSSLTKDELDAIAQNVEQELDGKWKAFLNSLDSYPSLDSFPIDETGYTTLIPQIKRCWIKDIFTRIMKKNTKHTEYELQDSLHTLFGTTDDGKIRIHDYYIKLFDSQKKDDLFERIWRPSNAWYYSMPLHWLIDNLATLITKKLFKARNDLNDLLEKATQKKLFTSSSEISEICDELRTLYGFSEIYHKHAEIWYWEQALTDIRSGNFYSLSTEAKERIERQLTILRNFKDGDFTNIKKDNKKVDWHKDISYEFEVHRPLPTPWTVETLENFIKYNCNWRWLNSTETGGIAYCAICSEIKGASKIKFKDSPIHLIWNFSSDIPVDGVFMVLLVPKKYLGEATGGGHQ